MSEELTLLKEYIDSLGLDPKTMTRQDLVTLSNELFDADEEGLARLVGGLKNGEELAEYVGEEE